MSQKIHPEEEITGKGEEKERGERGETKKQGHFGSEFLIFDQI